MRNNRSFAVALAGALGFIALLGSPSPAKAQAPGSVLGQLCNLMSDLIAPNVLRPVDATTKNEILSSGLPCQETVSAGGDPTKTQLENRQRGFDFYSWLTFIALNSPADEQLTIDKSKPGTPAKWEQPRNFKQLLDVMLPGGKASKWEDEKVIPPSCTSQYQKGMMVVEMIEESFNEPFKTGPLIDQQGNYAIFDILMNKEMFDYIQNNGLYSKAGQMTAKNAELKIDFPAGENPPTGQVAGGHPGAVMIKVSWKVLESESEKQNFHTVDALVLMPRHDDKTEPPCLRKTLGLVGFHVGHKTKSRLQWIWTSFEHVDNVPEQREVDSGKLKPSYNFYDPSCDPAKCPVNQTPPRPWDPTHANGLKFHSAFKSQITRKIPLTDDTVKMNKQFQAILGDTVWKHYMLLSTQWPSGFPCASQPVAGTLPPNTDFEKQPDMTCAPAPTYLANSTLETYSQGSIPLASSSCMACHGNAVSYQQVSPDKPNQRLFNQSDFTFMLEKAR